MEQPLISIIVPIYNGEKYLSRCIESLLQQTYKNVELILVNDGSSDSSLAICREYAAKQACIVVIDQQNAGVSTARNRGLEQAREHMLLLWTVTIGWKRRCWQNFISICQPVR